MFILFLFLVAGNGAHTDADVEAVVFKNAYSCEVALAAAIENAPEGVEASGFCQPQKVKKPKPS